MLGKYSLLWYLFLLAAAVVMRVFLRQVRRKADQFDSRSNDFDLADLQLLVARGQMTAEEFEKAKAVILSRSDSSRSDATFEPAKGFPVLAPRDQPKRDAGINDGAI